MPWRFNSRRLALPVLFVAALAGCGTMENLAHVEQPTRPYGGVAADFTACREIVSPSQPAPEGYFPGKNILLPTIKGICCCVRLADVPVSLVTDTLTLPFTLGQQPPPESAILGANMGPGMSGEESQGPAVQGPRQLSHGMQSQGVHGPGMQSQGMQSAGIQSTPPATATLSVQ
ncbi:MAG: YceK/YidQ family lipoprotein [Planctomycetes bacterium]|nr:YceK/YidQ family lipoprotein [Planctomycetota bacterium]